jgi:hypothetical protein
VYRLATTLLDHQRYPAGELITLYHQRWDIETAYLELKSSILGGWVLRARTPVGIEQEVYALLVTYQLLRTAMADATTTALHFADRRAVPAQPRRGHAEGRLTHEYLDAVRRNRQDLLRSRRLDGGLFQA